MKKLLFVFMFLCATSVFAINENDKDVPKVLKDRREVLVIRQNTEAIRFNEETGKYFGKKEYQIAIVQNDLAIAKLDSAYFQILLCEATGQGYYCEQSERDLNEAEYEIGKIKDSNDKAGIKL